MMGYLFKYELHGSTKAPYNIIHIHTRKTAKGMLAKSVHVYNFNSV
jgi:hypothetical protein